MGNFKQKQKNPGTIAGHGGFDLLHYPFKRVIADGFWNSVFSFVHLYSGVK
jgi:hypothetical protein